MSDAIYEYFIGCLSFSYHSAVTECIFSTLFDGMFCTANQMRRYMSVILLEKFPYSPLRCSKMLAHA